MALTEHEFGIMIRRVESLEEARLASAKILDRLARDIYQGNGRDPITITIANHKIRIHHLESARSEWRSAVVSFVVAASTMLIGFVLAKWS